MLRFICFCLIILSFPSIVMAVCPYCGKIKNEVIERDNLLKNKPSYPTPPPTLTRIKSIKKKKHSVNRILNPIEIYPEKTLWVKLSNTDLNRIVCTKGDITYSETSSEKGVVVNFKGSEMYIKFKKIIYPDGKIIYVTKPVEFFVRCGGETYSFIAIPEKIPSRTVYLISVLQKTLDENILKKNRVDTAIVDIIKKVFLNRIPPYWEKQKEASQIKMTKDIMNYRIEIKEQHYRYRIPGIPIIVRVFKINSDKKVQLNEKILLDPSITKNPIAISLLDHVIIPKIGTIGVILERMY